MQLSYSHTCPSHFYGSIRRWFLSYFGNTMRIFQEKEEHYSLYARNNHFCNSKIIIPKPIVNNSHQIFCCCTLLETGHMPHHVTPSQWRVSNLIIPIPIAQASRPIQALKTGQFSNTREDFQFPDRSTSPPFNTDQPSPLHPSWSTASLSGAASVRSLPHPGKISLEAFSPS